MASTGTRIDLESRAKNGVCDVTKDKRDFSGILIFRVFVFQSPTDGGCGAGEAPRALSDALFANKPIVTSYFVIRW